jgi:hypothetical protein
MVPPLMGDDAQKMQGIDVFRILRQRFAIKRFGFRQSPGPVMLQAKLNGPARFFGARFGWMRRGRRGRFRSRLPPGLEEPPDQRTGPFAWYRAAAPDPSSARIVAQSFGSRLSFPAMSSSR